jgi:hypothetical protein
MASTLRSLAALCAAACLAAGPAAAEELRGTWRLTRGGVTLTLVLEHPASGAVRGTLSSTSGATLALEGRLEDGIATGTCTGAGATSLFEAELDGHTLVLTLTELGATGVQGARSLEFARASGAASGDGPGRGAPSAAPAPGAKAPRPSAGAPAEGGDGELLRYFAGEYYAYTSGSTLSGGSGTERTVTLCPDGRYRDSSESSVSGSGWGAATQRRGGGRWRMEGNRERGVLVITAGDGQVSRVPYQVVDRGEQTVRFGGRLFAFAGDARCP